MSTGGTGDPPPYIILVGGNEGVGVYHLNTPFTPPPSRHDIEKHVTAAQTQNGQAAVPAAVPPSATDDGVKRFVSEDRKLGRKPGMTTCRLLLCMAVLIPIPFFLKHFKDAYHSCPRCHRVLHVNKKKFCS
ncbi:hypothetical protein ACEWY4_003500 [Coilia grayii]|uniref:LITAF domain-containing protein n=1 Tax=Coilia grayii TaxID=363190 RepID=A0ABD1KRF1_9TELE